MKKECNLSVHHTPQTSLLLVPSNARAEKNITMKNYACSCRCDGEPQTLLSAIMRTIFKILANPWDWDVFRVSNIGDLSYWGKHDTYVLKSSKGLFKITLLMLDYLAPTHNQRTSLPPTKLDPLRYLIMTEVG